MRVRVQENKCRFPPPLAASLEFDSPHQTTRHHTTPHRTTPHRTASRHPASRLPLPQADVAVLVVDCRPAVLESASSAAQGRDLALLALNLAANHKTLVGGRGGRGFVFLGGWGVVDTSPN